jgi:hypothetical protein
MIAVQLTVHAAEAQQLVGSLAENLRPEQIEHVLAQALRAALRPTLSAIAAGAPVGSTQRGTRPHLAGQLQRSIGLRVRERPRLRASITGAWYGRLVESGHRIVAPGVKGGTQIKLRRKTPLGRYGRVTGSVPPHPFVQPVLDAQRGQIEETLSRTVGEGLLREVRIAKAVGAL